MFALGAFGSNSRCTTFLLNDSECVPTETIHLRPRRVRSSLAINRSLRGDNYSDTGGNREFDWVIVLWPYEVSGNDERKRRLVYNAITRAKQEAFVVVQGEARVGQSPFAPGTTAPAPNAGRRKRVRRGHASEEPT